MKTVFTALFGLRSLVAFRFATLKKALTEAMLLCRGGNTPKCISVTLQASSCASGMELLLAFASKKSKTENSSGVIKMSAFT